MKEHFFQCPYCWEKVSTLIDTSIVRQQYIEDCEVCCNPLELIVDCKFNELILVDINPIAQ